MLASSLGRRSRSPLDPAIPSTSMLADAREDSRAAPERIGFFGGTFDPPHRGHLAVARATADCFALDRVLLAPVGIQPLKPSPPIAPYADRLEMVRLLCLEDPRLTASGLDAPLVSGQPNYTVTTVQRLKAQLPHTVMLYVIVGADAFMTLRKWRESERLLALADWIVVGRPGFALEDLSPLGLTVREREKIHILEGLDIPLTATGLRERLVLGDWCEDSLLPSISEYISEHRLYS